MIKFKCKNCKCRRYKNVGEIVAHSPTRNGGWKSRVQTKIVECFKCGTTKGISQ